MKFKKLEQGKINEVESKFVEYWDKEKTFEKTGFLVKKHLQ